MVVLKSFVISLEEDLPVLYIMRPQNQEDN